MPVFDTPLTTDDNQIERVMQQPLPLMLIFHRDDIDAPVDEMLRQAAKEHAGDILYVRMDARQSKDTYVRYGEPPTPALVTLTAENRRVKSDAARIRPADIRQHTQHLLHDKPLPAASSSSPAAGTQTPVDLRQPITVTDTTFRQDVLKSDVPVLVDFWAAWCGPCRQIAPYIDQLAQEYGGRIKVAKLNVDQNPVIASRYQVQSIPTFIMFEGGQAAQRIVGANPAGLRAVVKRFTI